MKKTRKSLPMVSFVIPVLNAEKLLPKCLSTILDQDYPKDKIEIIIAVGGSTDKSIEISQKHKAKIYHNKLKTAESGKAVGVEHATGEYICLLDSDNLLPAKNWLKEMVSPLIKDKGIVGSEPLYFKYRRNDGFIDRYCALIGMNDPLCLC